VGKYGGKENRTEADRYRHIQQANYAIFFGRAGKVIGEVRRKWTSNDRADRDRERHPATSPEDAGVTASQAWLERQEYQRQTWQHGAFQQHDQERDFHLRLPFEKQPDDALTSI
jgi:hypothetical protein